MAKAQTAEEFDRRFDEGEDIFDLAEIDSEKIKRANLETKRINIDVPPDFLKELDAHATRRGISRQSLIKVWLFERLQGESTQSISAQPRAIVQATLAETASHMLTASDIANKKLSDATAKLARTKTGSVTTRHKK